MIDFPGVIGTGARKAADAGAVARPDGGASVGVGAGAGTGAGLGATLLKDDAVLAGRLDIAAVRVELVITCSWSG